MFPHLWNVSHHNCKYQDAERPIRDRTCKMEYLFVFLIILYKARMAMTIKNKSSDFEQNDLLEKTHIGRNNENTQSNGSAHANYQLFCQNGSWAIHGSWLAGEATPMLTRLADNCGRYTIAQMRGFCRHVHRMAKILRIHCLAKLGNSRLKKQDFHTSW